MPALEARGVSKTYDRVRYVLEDVDLAVDPGEVVVVMGRSGSGKTTLLNILAGLETPTQGTVLVDGQDIASLDEDARTQRRREDIGVVFQRFHLIPELDVLENVRLPMKLAGRENATERARKLLAFFGLETHTDVYPATLSGGETQRAAIARALGNNPAVVLADEPTANLDEDNARNALDALRRVADETDTAVVIATHDPLGAEAGDRVLNLVDGVLEAEDAPTTGTQPETTNPERAEDGPETPSNAGTGSEGSSEEARAQRPDEVEEIDAEPIFEEVGEGEQD